jgi:hypothetical protein
MQLHKDIYQVMEKLPEDKLRQLLDYAKFLAQSPEEREWRDYSREQFARAYGADEPNYTIHDIKPEAGR